MIQISTLFKKLIRYRKFSNIRRIDIRGESHSFSHFDSRAIVRGVILTPCIPVIWVVRDSQNETLLLSVKRSRRAVFKFQHASACNVFTSAEIGDA